MDPLASFKSQIEAMFDKSFKELTQKNNLNRTILSNLIEAASDQSDRINQLDKKIDNLKKMANPEMGVVKNQIQSQERIIHDNFDKIMFRLSQIEEGITHSKKNLQQNLNLNKQSEQSMKDLLKHLQTIEREEKLPDYHGTKDQLYQEIEEFEKILQGETERMRQGQENVQMSKKVILEPLETFSTKIAVHNKNNENILKEKLKMFTEKLKNVQKRVEETAWMVQNETHKAKQEQGKIIEEMGKIQKQMGQLRNELETSDQKRKYAIQNNAIHLDNMVEEMLVETKKLEMRVEQLKKGYEYESERLKKNIK